MPSLTSLIKLPLKIQRRLKLAIKNNRVGFFSSNRNIFQTLKNKNDISKIFILNKTVIPLKIQRRLKLAIKNNRVGFFSSNRNIFQTLKNKNDISKIFILNKTVKLKPGEDLVVSITKTVADEAEIKIVNSKMHTVYQIEHSGTLVLNDLPGGRYFLMIKIGANREIMISDIDFYTKKSKELAAEDLGLKNKRLIIVPDYPSKENRYRCAFLHTRVKAYVEAGFEVDLLVVNGINKRIEKYEYDGISVNKISYGQLRKILLLKKYQQIMVHFFNEFYAQVLDAVDTSETELFLYSHGADFLYWDYPIYGRRYFEPKYEMTLEMINRNKKMDTIIKRYNKMSNTYFVFVCEWSKERCEKLLNIKINKPLIVPCLIDEEIFQYKKKDEEQRKKICLIRSFHNLNSYSIDTDIKVILELSRRPFFNDLDFSIYGTGEMHKILVDPVRKFKNVKIYENFLSSKEMGEMFSRHGLALFATRYDNQAVSTLECALSGTIPLTSFGTGLSCFLDEKIGNFSEAEDVKHMADLLETYYKNPKKFLETSEQVHNSIAKTATRKYSIEKELKILRNSILENSLINQKPLDTNPLLTVVVPAYNCGVYLRNGIFSLINHKFNNLVEVIIVNDGSKDNTLKIAKNLAKLSPSIKVISKNNGGHGSTINSGIRAATGKYFKLMDGDDYFNTDALLELLNKLKDESADIILTNYVEDLANKAEMRSIGELYNNLPEYQQMDLDDMMHEGYGFKFWGPLLSTTTVKTELLKAANIKIDEHCFYVDMEYNFMIYSQSKNVIYYPLNLYIYYLGRDGQSVNRESVRKNYLQHEQVCLRLLQEYYKIKESLTPGKDDYIKNRLITEMCKSQYYITMNYLDNNNGFRRFDKALRKYPEFYNSKLIADAEVMAYRLTGGKIKIVSNQISRLYK